MYYTCRVFFIRLLEIVVLFESRNTDRTDFLSLDQHHQTEDIAIKSGTSLYQAGSKLC